MNEILVVAVDLRERMIANLGGRFAVRAQFGNGMRELQERLEREIAEGKHTIPEQAAIPTAQIGEAAAASLSN